MNATQQIVDLNEGQISQMVEVRPESDPRVIRWGYNPGARGITINPRQTGLNTMFIPVGKFLPHILFQTPQENCTLDEYKDKEFLVDVTAAEIQETFQRILGEVGYQSFGYSETDVVKMAAMNAVLLPSLQEIREMFETGCPIPKSCPGEDEMDIGNPRTHCATCHYDWIRSDACQLWLHDALNTGRTMLVRDENGEIRERKVQFSPGQLSELRQMVENGLGSFIQAGARLWAQTISELDNKVRDKIQDAEHFIRKDLHQIKPQNKEVELVKQVAQATQSGSNNVLDQLVASNAQTAQAVGQLAQLMSGLMSGQIALPAQPQPEAPAAPGDPDNTPAAAGKTRNRS